VARVTCRPWTDEVEDILRGVGAGAFDCVVDLMVERGAESLEPFGYLIVRRGFLVDEGEAQCQLIAMPSKSGQLGFGGVGRGLSVQRP
jgi:hypothetical protein